MTTSTDCSTLTNYWHEILKKLYIKNSLRSFSGGQKLIRREEFVHTQPTTNGTIQEKYPDDKILLSGKQWSSDENLERALTKEQHSRYMDLLKLIMFVFDANNITYRYV